MDQLPWYRRLFSSPAPCNFAATLQKAEAGDAESQFALGLKFCTDSSAPDFTQAARWYQKAAIQDHALAQFNLSRMFAAGQGVAQDNEAALVWVRKAAEGGDAGAQFQLGSKYHRTSVGGVPAESAESRVEAYKWFHLAADQGYHGSEAARERVALTMSRDEVASGNNRVGAFVSRKPLRQPDSGVPAVTE